MRTPETKSSYFAFRGNYYRFDNDSKILITPLTTKTKNRGLKGIFGFIRRLKGEPKGLYSFTLELITFLSPI